MNIIAFLKVKRAEFYCNRLISIEFDRGAFENLSEALGDTLIARKGHVTERMPHALNNLDLLSQYEYKKIAHASGEAFNKLYREQNQ